MYRASRIPTETLFLAALPDVGPSGCSGGPVWGAAGPAVPWGLWSASGAFAGLFRGRPLYRAPSPAYVLPAAGPALGTAYAGRSGWPGPARSPAGAHRSSSPGHPGPGRRKTTASAFRRALTRTTTNFKDRQVLRRQHLPVPLCTFRGTHVPNHANVRVVDLHSLPRMFGPLHILLMHHDFLNEQPQQFRRQFLDVGVAPGF